MSEPVTRTFWVIPTGDNELDAINAIGKVMSWLYSDYPSKKAEDRLRDGAAVERVARYVKERYAAP